MKKWISRSVIVIAMFLGLTAIQAWAADAPSGTFRYAENVVVVTMDPHKHTGGGIVYLSPVYETLFQRTPENKIVPFLATDYNFKGLTVEFTLREDVSFSDGEPLTAEVAAANINRGAQLKIVRSLFSVQEARATGKYTFEVTLKKPDPSFIESLAGVGGMMVSSRAMADPALDRNPVGTGPYVYNAELSREGEKAVYTLNKTYWDPAAQGLEKIEILAIPDDTARLNALATGQIDMAMYLSSPQAKMVENTPGLRLIKKIGGSAYHLVIMDREGTKVPAFADKRVRQAMSYAIDRQAFSDVVQFGLATPAVQPVAKGHWAYNPALAGKFEYNPAKARQLLAEAGYPDGFTFSIPSISVFAARLEALAGFFGDVGITMKIVPVEPGTLARRSRNTEFPATNLVWGQLRDPSFLATWYLNEDASFNPFKVKPGPRLAELMKQGAATMDIDKRAPVYREMFEIIADEAIVIYITTESSLTGSSEKMANNPTVKFAAGTSWPNWRGLRKNQ